jgi:hypothetical protein
LAIALVSQRAGLLRIGDPPWRARILADVTEHVGDAAVSGADRERPIERRLQERVCASDADQRTQRRVQAQRLAHRSAKIGLQALAEASVVVAIRQQRSDDALRSAAALRVLEAHALEHTPREPDEAGDVCRA